MEHSREGVECGCCEPEAHPQAGRGAEQQPIGHCLVVGEELADDEQDHRGQVGDQSGQVDSLAPEATGQAPPSSDAATAVRTYGRNIVPIG
jgi:hypothetical protein